MWHQGQYSSMKININPKRIDPQGDYGSKIVTIWVLSWIVDTFYVFQLADEEKVSFFVPIPLILILAASIYYLFKIKK